MKAGTISGEKSHIRVIMCVFSVILFLLLSSTGVKADFNDSIEDVKQEKENLYSCSFEGVKHTFVLDLPEKTGKAPLVIMLPGYGNTAETFRNSIHFEESAVPLGYAVVYVTGSSNPGDPTSAVGWNSGISAEGNNDTEFLVALADYLQETYVFDRHRIFAVGFSNGAFMSHRLAMEASDTFSAVVSVAGLMPESIWNERKAVNNVSVFQITGEKDEVIPKNSDGSAKYSKAPAIEDVVEYWAHSNGLELTQSKEPAAGTALSIYSGENTQKQVWHLWIKGGRHSWPSSKLNGIDANALILEFLETQK